MINNFVKMLIVVAIIAIGVPSVTNAAYLSIGSSGSEVVRLQTFLINNGFPIPLIESGAASKGYFGVQTKDAVMMYQESVGEYPSGSIDSSIVSEGLKLGGATGPNVNYRSFFNEGVTYGGSVSTSSTATSYTLVAKDLARTPSVVFWTPNVNTTISISATSTFGYVPRVGDVAKVLVQNASSTAGSSITFAAANTQVDLQFVEATGGDLVLNGLDFAELTLLRKSANVVTVLFHEFVEAD